MLLTSWYLRITELPSEDAFVDLNDV